MKPEYVTNSKRDVINDFLVSLKALSKVNLSMVRCIHHK